MGAAIASATVNFAYEYTRSDHNIIAGGYLALLSLFGMVMLHEFLDQFEEGAAYVKRGNPKFGLRWVTWPTNTFCAAVAWRNYPPAEGTAATILNAVANLDRVRAGKQAARDAKIVARHQQALAAARRKEELQAALAGGGIAEGEDATVTVGVPGSISNVEAFPVETVQEVLTPLAVAPPVPPECPFPQQPDREEGDDVRVTVRVPATAGTLMEWANLWIRMCSDGASVLGPLNEEDARTRYDLTAKQLRNVRNAATSGALRRKAIALGVQLPPGYVDSPATDRADDHGLAGAAA